MKYFKILFLYMFISFFFASCEKKILEIVPVIEIEDLSINTNQDIVLFSFGHNNTAFAASKTTLFKSKNNGQTWDSLLNENLTDIKCLGFFNENEGLCLSDNKLYKTENGGQEWYFIRNADYFELADDGRVVLIECSFTQCNIYLSDDRGDTYCFLEQVDNLGDFITARLTNSNIFCIREDTYRFAIDGVNINSGTKFYIRLELYNHGYNPIDVYMPEDFEDDIIAVSNGGAVLDKYGREYYGHGYDYYSVDGYGDLIVAVGYHTICSNMKIQSGYKWNEVFDTNGNGFENTFNRIRFADENHFYVSGNKGLIWKAKI